MNATDVIASQQLPAYFRVDAGARHEFAIHRLGAQFVAFANVDNIFDRRNTIGYTTDTGATGQKALQMMPLSATFGLEWRF
jgi:outer membrane receptor protein involved in Fe transport